MNLAKFTLLFLLFLQIQVVAQTTDFTIAFGSCNKQYMENKMWKEIIKNKPKLWIWGGDNIYSDTENMGKMWRNYKKVLSNKDYKSLLKTTEIMATWDDHDYGLNDGGYEFSKKKEAQQLFLDFIGVSKKDKRRQQEGIYTSKIFKTSKGSIKVIILDTRYFRSKLKKSTIKGKRYEPDTNESKTMLGKTQWNWLTNELKKATEDFTIVVSSIQFLSSEHGFEKWENFPKEVQKLKNLVTQSPSNIILLSGDRHISEFSIDKNDKFKNPLIDFTSSGLTHTYRNFSGEPNPYRHGSVVSKESFGVLKFDFKNNTVTFEMRGFNNVLQQQYIQVFR